MQTTIAPTAAAQMHIACDSFPPLASKAARTPRQLYHAGYAAFCNLEDISVLVSEDERKGYFQAMKDCADLDTEIYLAKRVRQ